MKFVEITEKQKEKFQSLVKINGSFLQDWQWGEFQKSMGKDLKRFAIEESVQVLSGIAGEQAQGISYSFTAQGYLSKTGGKSYFFMPYGPVILPGLKEDQLQSRLDFFYSQLQMIYGDLIFARFELLQYFAPQELKPAIKTKDLDPKKTLILDLTHPEDQLLAAMHPKTRYNIRLAQKKGVQVKIADVLTDQEVNLFEETAVRAGIRAFEKNYYQKLVEFFKDDENIQAKVYSAWHENDLLAVNIMVYCRHGFADNQMIYLFGGSSDIKRNLMAPYLLHWQAILDAKKEGFRQYDFWGIEEDPKHPWYGFSKFKLGFGGRIASHSGTYDYVLNRTWYNVYKLLRGINRLIKR